MNLSLKNEHVHVRRLVSRLLSERISVDQIGVYKNQTLAPNDPDFTCNCLIWDNVHSNCQAYVSFVYPIVENPVGQRPLN